MELKQQEERPGDRLLAAATRLFRRHGFNATGIGPILAEAGVSKMTLYNRFGSKDGLILAVLERESDLWCDWFDAALRRLPGTPTERIAGVFDLLAEWLERDGFQGCLPVNAVAENDKLDPRFRVSAATHNMKLKNILQPLVETASPADPEAFLAVLCVLIDGAIVGSMVARSTEPVRHAQNAIHTLLATRVRAGSRADAA